MKPKVLFVDDDPNILASFRAGLRKLYRIETASHAREALDILQARGPMAVVVSDLRMPEMDGIEFLSRVREIAPDTVRIMLTGHADLEASMKAVNEGHIFRFLTKPVQQETLRLAVDAGIHQYELVTQIKEKQRIIEDDLRAAVFIQQRFLPGALPELPNLDVYWKFLPSEFVGGDMFNVFQLDAERLGVYVLDVSGHGVASALLAVAISQLLLPQSGYLLDGEGTPIPPAQVLKNLDINFPIDRFERHFTIFYGYMDRRTGDFHYSSAGHQPPLLLHKDGTMEQLEEGGSLIGLGGFVDFEQGHIQLDPDDRILAYTDGVVEYENTLGERYNLERLIASCQGLGGQSAESIVEHVYRAMLDFGKDAPQGDDVTILCIGGLDREQEDG